MSKIVNRVEGFTYTTAIAKLRRMTKRIRGVKGGTSAGKTYGILPILIDIAARIPKIEISVVSESIPHLRKGALKDFLAIMQNTNRYIDSNYNRTLLTYTFVNQSYIEFFSADQDSKVRGPRRHILYINECNNITFETYHQLAIRTRDVIYLDFNPVNEFWYDTELRQDEDFEELILTYKDNEALAPSIIRELEKARLKAFLNPHLAVHELFTPSNIINNYWANWWKVYGLGMTGCLEGVVYKNWKLIDAVPLQARLIGYGLDFGFTNSPTALVAAYLFNGQVIWDELIYATEMTNRDIANAMRELGVIRSSLIIADSAEPKSIAELRSHGFSIKAVSDKDIAYGISIMQESEFLVTKSSLNMINELRRGVWAVDKKTGKSLNVPVKAFDHCLDAMRYLAVERLSHHKKRGRGVR